MCFLKKIFVYSGWITHLCTMKILRWLKLFRQRIGRQFCRYTDVETYLKPANLHGKYIDIPKRQLMNISGRRAVCFPLKF
jgi:hypothetical protein